MPTVPRWLIIYLTGEGPGPQASFGRRAKTVLAGSPELAEGMSAQYKRERRSVPGFIHVGHSSPHTQSHTSYGRGWRRCPLELHRRAVYASGMDRNDERDAIDRHIAKHGITRCTAAYAAAVAGALPQAEERVRLAHLTPRSLTREEIKRFLYVAYGPQARRSDSLTARDRSNG
jgi:hypothetical protein